MTIFALGRGLKPMKEKRLSKSLPHRRGRGRRLYRQTGVPTHPDLSPLVTSSGSKRQARRQYQGMIVRVVRTDRDLLAEAEGQAEPARIAGSIVLQRNAAEDDARRCKYGDISIRRTALEVARVDLKL